MGARSMQDLPAALMTTRRNYKEQPQLQEDSTKSVPLLFEQNVSNEVDDQESQPQPQRMNFILPSLYEMRHMFQEMMSTNVVAEKREQRQPLFFDPYAHLGPQQGASIEEERREEKKGSDHDDENKQFALTQLTETVDFASNTTSD